MAKQQQQQDKKIGFKSTKLFKDQTLGIGSYGKVCKAKCDDLLCAAKLMHETLFDPTAHRQIAPQRQHRLPMRRFELECEFLSTIRHPNIVQYLGMYQDPDTGLPVLLMELMDDSLTHFLESLPQPIPYHVQVNLCHDITLALSFLHSNNIVHRDLSSNNVLMIGNIKAKVTDFGMARLGDLNPQATRLTFTMCPGTDVYMPPEAVDDKPVYTEKIDCFSFGVIIVQILTRQFPEPGDRNKLIEINHPQVRGGIVKVSVPEVDRRQNHIREIDPNYPLLPIALNCLKDRDVDRPSAQQLCDRVGALKESPTYCSESMNITVEGVQVEHHNNSLHRDLQQSVTELSKVNDQVTDTVQDKDEVIEGQERQLESINQQEKESEQVLVETHLEEHTEQLVSQSDHDLGDRIEQQVSQSANLQTQQQSEATTSSRVEIKLKWREWERAPSKMHSDFNAAVDGSVVYVRSGDESLCLYCQHLHLVSTSKLSLY